MKAGNKKENFRDFLMHHLSASDFERLHEYLGGKKRLATLIVNEPFRGNLTHLSMIVKLIKKLHPEVTETMLVEKFGFGSEKITKSQRELLSN